MTDDTYTEWSIKHPQAALELQAIQLVGVYPPTDHSTGHSEDWAQANIRMAAAKRGALLWRNNVGATKTKEVHVCPACRFKFEVARPPIRWGLCNDSAKLNAKLKSSDLIGCVPRVILSEDVGKTLGQFAAVEAKKPDWRWKGDKHEQAQASYGSLVQSKGGLFAFSTGAWPW
jgi:hypothetical protein